MLKWIKELFKKEECIKIDTTENDYIEAKKIEGFEKTEISEYLDESFFIVGVDESLMDEFLEKHFSSRCETKREAQRRVIQLSKQIDNMRKSLVLVKSH